MKFPANQEDKYFQKKSNYILISGQSSKIAKPTSKASVHKLHIGGTSHLSSKKKHTQEKTGNIFRGKK